MTDESPLFDDAGEAPPRRDPITVRSAVAIGGRALAGVIAIASSVAVVAAASVIALPTIAAEPASELVTPVPTAQQLVCAGGALRLADDTGQGATTASALGVPTLDFASNTGRVDATVLAESDASTGGTEAAPTVISTPPDAADPNAQVLVSGAQAEIIDSGDFVGLVTSSCALLSADIWLVGGSTAVGRTTLLTLSNPTEVPATVTLELFGERGEIVAPGTSGIVVAPNGQRVLSLAGFQPGIESPVVHLSSAGGQVVAGLQQSIVRGLEPGGMDAFGASAQPATSTVIPGVVISDLAALQELSGAGDAFADAATTVRLFAPGEGTVTGTVSIVPLDGTAQSAAENEAPTEDADRLVGTTGIGDSFPVEFEAGRVTDIPLEALGTGTYSVRVETDLPAVAAVRVTAAALAATGGANDFAWLTSARPLTDVAQFTVARAPGPVLHLVNPSETAVTVSVSEVDAPNGVPREVTVDAGGATTVLVTGGASYLVEGAAGLAGAVTFTDAALIGGYPVAPPGVASAPIRVYP